ncbi:hypothetical protein BDV93DRAFT_605854 [Ceratobasidium sp. AG-I]|nr:hypothetical protein BDV93DRAFT_605854 [Ceratobasidium sp. AG-I]
MKFAVFLSLAFPLNVECFWKSPPANTEVRSRVPSSQLGKIRELQGDSQDLSVAIKQLNALKVHSQRSDCFRDASLALHTGCESLDFDSDARVKAAVHMALCELTTADQVSLPLECKFLGVEASPKEVSQALARSAQHWSSYSGYLREIPQLCSAYRRLHEIDHAKSIYANITEEKAELLSSLDVYHSKLIVREQEMEALTKALGTITTVLEQHSYKFDDSLAMLPHQTGELMNQVQRGVTVLLELVAADTRVVSQNAFANLEHQLTAVVSEAQTALSSAASDMNDNVDSLAHSLDAIALSWNSRMVIFNRRLDIMWDETFIRKLALEKALDDLNSRVSEAGAQVGAQLVSAEKIQELSSAASASIQDANLQITSASVALSRELGALVSITQEVQSNLTRLPDRILSAGWFPSLFSPISSIVSGIHFPTWQAQLVMQVVGVGASGIQNSLSLLLTFTCAFLFLISRAFQCVSRMVGSLAKRCSKRGKSSGSKDFERPQLLLSKRRVYRRPQANRSRLSAMMPHYETGAL